MYCKGNHKSFECDKYTTPQERSRYLRDHKLCLICASSQHITSQCQRRPCFKCQQRHHTPCCFQSSSKRWNSIPGNELNYKKEVRRTSTGKKEPKLHKSSVKVNQLGNEEQENASPEEKSILEVQPGKCFKSKQGTFLPTGELTVMNSTTRKLRKVDVLLDTGAEISFIDTTLAEELELPTIKETTLRLHTFESDKVKEKRSRKVPLEVWDTEGRPLSLVLFTHDILTKPFATAPVCEEDLVFLRQQNLSVNFIKNKLTVKPSILLGCDLLWPLLRKNEPHLHFPSRLHLLSTRLGYLVTGQVNKSPYIETQEDEVDKWDGYWALDGQINTVSLPDETLDDNDWEKYWKLESARTEEFSTSEKEERARTDQKVWEVFNQTIEKGNDGYYVRLPWKEVNASLPDNRAIAQRRLSSVWNSLQKDEDLLEKYNAVFEDQLRQHVLEEVPEQSLSEVCRVHYIPHQAVLTPHKTTTKLRVVYDASAHYKGCSSLNDVLQRSSHSYLEFYSDSGLGE